MSAKWSIFNRLSVFAAALAASLASVTAQEATDSLSVLTKETAETILTKETAETLSGIETETTETLSVLTEDSLILLTEEAAETLPSPAEEPAKKTSVYTSKARQKRFDHRLHHYRKGWKALIPTHAKIQYAGNMGFLSAGFGWDYGKHTQWETDLYFGFVPKFNSSRPKFTTSLRQCYMPWSFDLGKKFYLEPLSAGLYLNYIWGNQFWRKEPSRYPGDSYYGFMTSLRLNIFLGQRITYKLPPKLQCIGRSVTLFYELSSYDLMIVSAATNSYLKPKDYLSLSFGVKLQFL